MISKRIAVRVAAVAAFATAGLGLGAGMASAVGPFTASVPGCTGGMKVTNIGGHDYVQGYVTSTTGAYCSVTLKQSTGRTSSAGTTSGTVYTEQFQDSGITSFVSVCNGDGRCANSASY